MLTKMHFVTFYSSVSTPLHNATSMWNRNKPKQDVYVGNGAGFLA